MDKLQQEDVGQLAQMRIVIFSRYCDLVLNHPWKTILTTLGFSFTLVILSVAFHYQVFDFDPVKGFETRGTTLANARLTLDAIKRTAASPFHIMNSQFEKNIKKRQAKVFQVNARPPDNVTTTSGKTTERVNDETASLSTTLEPISINYDDYGADPEPKIGDLADPCVQYMALGERIPYQVIDYSAKIILEVDDRKLFTVDVFRKLCEVDRIIDAEVETSAYKPRKIFVKNSFNLPFYANCLNFTTPNTCEAINVHDIETLRITITKCRKNYSLPICSSQLFGQIFNYSLPRSKNSNYVSILLKIAASDGGGGSLQFYNKLLESLKNHLAPEIILKGAFFNVKNSKFLHALANDTKIASISAVLVLSCFLFYTRSVFYTFVIFVIFFLSMGIAFFFYTVILRINFFPALNVLVLVLMIAVGADDAFLLLVYYRRYKKLKVEPYQIGEPYIPLYKEHDRVIRAIRASMRHSLASMFVTSATTAVAFISNLSSDIIVLRCFGVYASLTIIVNYLLVIFLLPSTMVLCCKEGHKKFLPNVDIASKIAYVVFRYRYFLVVAAITATVAAGIAVFLKPGLSLPRFNPTKVVGSDCFLEFARKFLPSPVCEDFAVTPSDGPIFDKKFKLLGYYISVPSNVTVTMDSNDVEKIAEEIDKNCKQMVPVDGYPRMCLTTADMTRYYDIIATLRSSTLYSVTISVLVSMAVVILCTRRVLLSIVSVTVVCGVILWTIALSILFGWELSVVESTIIVLTIGLSFDFTLHFAVSYRDNKENCAEIRIRFVFATSARLCWKKKPERLLCSSCLSSAGRACLLGAITSILCGIPLLFAYTAAFTQVGSLLLTLGVTSLCGATIAFPAALACWTTLCSRNVYIVRF
ncbi:hypothetical protein NECAME_01299 [Necator americanus]|uniref:SSD domain-containing protein n=1 Tax=Necator americanus TaxID=51031 RepID=W2TYJ0_NECAM|nr:hypothetical protein NECAME_01299 [Necator americanus]ETN87140.1 hypothetical protein NECAME_01299 [Necator americanus]